MMKKVLRCAIAVLLVLVLTVGATDLVAVADNTEKENGYYEAINLLNQYLLNSEEITVDIEEVVEMFTDLGSYKNSKFFVEYATILYNCEKGFHLLSADSLELITLLPEFADEIIELSETYFALGTVEELVAYANARYYEACGSLEKAYAGFIECIGFYDAMEHYSYVKNSYVALTTPMGSDTTLLERTQTVAVATKQLIRPVLSLRTDGNGILLSWTSAENAEYYNIFRRRTKDEASYTYLGQVKGLSYVDTKINRNYYYEYYIQAVSPTGETMDSDMVTHIVKAGTGSGSSSGGTGNGGVQSSNTNKNETKVDTNIENDNHNVSQNENISGSTSSSESTVVSKDETTIINKPETNVTVEINDEPEWGPWSAWSTEKPYDTGSNREIDQRTVEKEVQTTYYNYSRWSYFNTDYGYTMYSYTEYRGDSYKEGSGKWQYKSVKTPLAKTKKVSGGRIQQYTDYYYNETITTKTETQEVTEYRYRDRND